MNKFGLNSCKLSYRKHRTGSKVGSQETEIQSLKAEGKNLFEPLHNYFAIRYNPSKKFGVKN